MNVYDFAMRMEAEHRAFYLKRIFIVLISILLLAPLDVPAQTYRIDPAHTSIQFKIRNMMVTNVTGIFEKFKGTVYLDEADMGKSKVEVSIETASINTGINKRDNHLRSSDFLDVAQYPAMTFVSTSVESGTDKLRVTGNLTIKGVTRQVVLLVDGPKSLQDRIRPSELAAATINRQDFGVRYGAVIADEVFITITTELVVP